MYHLFMLEIHIIGTCVSSIFDTLTNFSEIIAYCIILHVNNHIMVKTRSPATQKRLKFVLIVILQNETVPFWCFLGLNAVSTGPRKSVERINFKIFRIIFSYAGCNKFLCHSRLRHTLCALFNVLQSMLNSSSFLN